MDAARNALERKPHTPWSGSRAPSSGQHAMQPSMSAPQVLGAASLHKATRLPKFVSMQPVERRAHLPDLLQDIQDPDWVSYVGPRWDNMQRHCVRLSSHLERVQREKQQLEDQARSMCASSAAIAPVREVPHPKESMSPSRVSEAGQLLPPSRAATAGEQSTSPLKLFAAHTEDRTALRASSTSVAGDYDCKGSQPSAVTRSRRAISSSRMLSPVPRSVTLGHSTTGNSDEPPLVQLKRRIQQEKLRLRDLFMMMDTNNDRRISKGELGAYLEALHIPHNEETLMQLFQELDKDQSGHISLEELESGLRDSFKHATAPR